MTEPTLRNLRTGFRAQRRILVALMIRDMMLRYGRNNLGFLWVILEPMILTVAVLLLFSVVKSAYEHGAHVISMVFTGYMAITMYRHTTNQGVRMLHRSIAILFHRNVTTIDVFLARVIMEGIGTTAALVTVYGVLWATKTVEGLYDPGKLVAAWFLLWWYCSSVALIITAITEFSETMERFVQPFQYIMVPLSGVFFLVDWLPEHARRIILFNPLTNCIEFFRDGFFGGSITAHYDPVYPMIWALLNTWIGLWLLGVARTRLHPN
ncbi:MAG: ABC transporter permease [Hyphomicrobiaceae bacterium]